MAENIINVQNISKEYRLGVINHGMLYKDIQSWIAKKLGKHDPHLSIDSYNKEVDTEGRFFALRDVSFTVKEGDRIGIIGRNGAGKSTLLKILSRVTAPTEGMITIKGKVSSLLEVGTGFHPELTGRENVFLNGSILGMRKNEIKKKFDEIVEFAECGKFIDTPVKRYSSGMYVRLAFAVAAHLDPDILIIDEVLAVGDISFQKKCLGKMSEVSKEGRTILFVSHNLPSIVNLCNKGLVLDKGSVSYSGDAASAVNNYTKSTKDSEERAINNGKASVKGKVKFISARMINSKRETITSSSIHNPFAIEMKFIIGDNITGLQIPNYHFKTIDGIYAFTVGMPNMKPLKPGIYNSICKIPGNFFNDGLYNVGLAVTEYRKSSMKIHFFEENYLTITIIDSVIDNPLRYNYGGPIPGVLRPLLEWDIIKQD